jgi:chromosome segregation ATPase
MGDDAPDPASQGLAKLTAHRDEARRRVDQLEADQRAAVEEREKARGALIEAERTGVSAAERKKLEDELVAAEAHAAERWPERIEGARRAVRDADAEIQVYARANLPALIEEVEAEGRAVVERINGLAAELVAACQERSAVEARLFSTLSLTGRTNRPGDVNRGRSDAIASALAAFLRDGGEVAPQVRVPELLGQSAAA